jgi:hypothetical protein
MVRNLKKINQRKGIHEIRTPSPNGQLKSDRCKESSQSHDISISQIIMGIEKWNRFPNMFWKPYPFPARVMHD